MTVIKSDCIIWEALHASEVMEFSGFLIEVALVVFVRDTMQWAPTMTLGQISSHLYRYELRRSHGSFQYTNNSGLPARNLGCHEE